MGRSGARTLQPRAAPPARWRHGRGDGARPLRARARPTDRAHRQRRRDGGRSSSPSSSRRASGCSRCSPAPSWWRRCSSSGASCVHRVRRSCAARARRSSSSCWSRATRSGRQSSAPNCSSRNAPPRWPCSSRGAAARAGEIPTAMAWLQAAGYASDDPFSIVEELEYHDDFALGPQLRRRPPPSGARSRAADHTRHSALGVRSPGGRRPRGGDA